MKKVAILYIALGKYDVMWNGFYESAKIHFLKDYEKHYFVFTDSKRIQSSFDISIIKTINYGWPGNTLYRFKMFNSINDELSKYDYIYFFNANACFKKDVDKEMIPLKEEFISVKHFNYLTKHPAFIGYDRNKKSTAFVQWGKEPEVYCQACILGGQTKPFLKMSLELDKNIDIDDKNGICAAWHDESHFNHYLLKHDVKALDITYAFPEMFLKGEEPYILMRDKDSFLDINVLRHGKKKTFKEKIRTKSKNFLIKMNCFFHYIFWGFYK